MPEITHLRREQLIPYEGNPRDNDGAVDAVADSIARFGFNCPIVVDRNNVVVAGHTRLRAAERLGIEVIPTIVADLDEQKAAEYRIADNKTQEFSEWLVNDLIAELRETKDMDGYFKNFNVSALLSETAGAVAHTAVTEGAIEGRKQELESFFLEKSESDEEKYVQVVCPGCGSEFFIDGRK